MLESQELILFVIAIFFGIGLHEYAHAMVADAAGDPTPGSYGRVTLNLFKHFEPVGTIMILLTMVTGFGIGWGKPVPMNPSKMKNPKWDHFWAVAAGPLSNIMQAVVWAFLGRVLIMAGMPESTLLIDFFKIATIVNCGLCLFNLLPIGPLDGMWLLGTFLSDKSRYYWTRWNLSMGQYVFIGIILLGQMNPSLSLTRALLGPVRRVAYNLLWGAPY